MKKLTFLISCLFFLITKGQDKSSLESFLSTPYIGDLIGSGGSSDVAFTLNEKGYRNIYISSSPYSTITKLTDFNSDEGQELSSLSMSYDGKWIVFARGGDHGANSAARATNSASLTTPTNVEVYSIETSSKKVYKIGNGDFPIINPVENTVTFLRNGEVFVANLNNGQPAKQLFSMKGKAGNLQWSPDGKKLAFVSKRGDYSFIGIYTTGESRINWLSPSYHLDSSPQWSPDGKQIAFIRRNANSGPIDSLTTRVIDLWSVELADQDSKESKSIYIAAKSAKASYPSISGQANLKWKHPKYLTFQSFEDSWPHLYRLDAKSMEVKQLTSGDFTIENHTISDDGKTLIYAANTGSNKEDIDRLHLFSIHLENGKQKVLSEGIGIETAPQFINHGNQILFKSSGIKQPIQPSIIDLNSNKKTLLAGSLFENISNNFVTPQQVKIKSSDGIVFHGQYFTPVNAEENCPAIVYVHGGPRRQMYLGWHPIDYYFYDYIANQYLVSQGYAVLSINYRMGSGYGYDFQHPENAGNLGASEYLDVLAAGKWLQQQKGISSNKIGIIGGSYGGYLTAMALGKNSDIFKVGVDIHGVHNRQRKQNPDYYAPDFELASNLSWESSPSKWVENWKSPVLLIHGDDDQNVDFSQSIDLYKRLIKKNIDVETLILPDENHHWQLFENLVKVKKATVNFLDKHLKN